MGILQSLANSVLFWAAWIVIPFLMEIVPAIGSVFILLHKHFHPMDLSPTAIYPEITILIPVYNSAETLEKCIQSIEESDYPDDRIRIFLVNNEGKDDSFHVFTECQKKYPNLLMQWMNAKQGKSRALNLALFNSEGKYIINIDSDGFLEPSALKNMVMYLEHHPEFDCATGAILTDMEQIKRYKRGPRRIFRELEFMEYAQAFLAGRSYAEVTDSIYTLSGAFSAFRKSAVLKSQLYNTDTITEDTQLTFQMKYLYDRKVGICEKAIFIVDPIESIDKLYTQRQRWQIGSLEVSHMFLRDKLKVRKMFLNPSVRTLVYDHTFAFPRMIWYLALLCLLCMNYSIKVIVGSILVLFLLYIIMNYIYFFSISHFLKEFKEIRRYYMQRWYIVPLMPFFNLLVFFFRFIGIVNSIDSERNWKTDTIHEENQKVKTVLHSDFNKVLAVRQRIYDFANTDEVK